MGMHNRPKGGLGDGSSCRPNPFTLTLTHSFAFELSKYLKYDSFANNIHREHIKINVTFKIPQNTRVCKIVELLSLSFVRKRIWMIYIDTIFHCIFLCFNVLLSFSMAGRTLRLITNIKKKLVRCSRHFMNWKLRTKGVSHQSSVGYETKLSGVNWTESYWIEFF